MILIVGLFELWETEQQQQQIQKNAFQKVIGGASF